MSPIAVLFAGVALTSTAPLLVKLALGEASPVVIAMLRMVITAALVTPFAWAVQGQHFRRYDRRRVLLTVAAGLLLALSFVLWMSSMAMTSVASSVVLGTTMPLWVALAGPFFTKDKVGTTALVGVAVAIGGAAILAAGDAGLGMGTLAGNGLALLSAMTNAGHRLLGRVLREDLPLLAFIGVLYPVAAAALLLTGWASGQQVTGLSEATYGWILLLALGPQIIGHSIYNWALGKLTAVTVTSGIMVEPVFSILWAALLLADTPTVTQVAGGLVVLAGVYVTQRAQAQPQPESVPGAAPG